MSLTVERVFQDPALAIAATDCFFHDSAVCCMTDARYRWLRWEGKKPNIAAALDESRARIFSSVDQGATWGLMTDVNVPTQTQWNEIFSPGGNRLLAGIFDGLGYAYDASYSLLPRSEDGGLTWTSAVTSGFFGSLTFQAHTQRFVKLPTTTTVLAFGQYEVSGAPYNVLRSTDNGLTFTAFSDVGVFQVNDAVALTATDVVAVDSSGLNAFYSHDGGATWAAASKPLFADIIGAPVSLGSGIVLTFGRTTGANLGAVFKSVDSGETYTLFSMIGSEVNRTQTLRASTTTTLLAGAGGSSPNILQKWWLSEDAGVSWSEASSIVGDRVPNSDSSSMTITTQGFMLAALDRPTRASASSDNIGEIWRGAVDGFISTGIGTCEATLIPPIAAGMLGTHLLCIPTLSPAPCPQPCPTDPPQPAALLITPGVAGGGWLDPLGVTDLVDLITVPGIMGRPVACGSLFANNYCAVAGV